MPSYFFAKLNVVIKVNMTIWFWICNIPWQFLRIQSLYAVVWNTHFYLGDHLDFVEDLINVYLLQKVIQKTMSSRKSVEDIRLSFVRSSRFLMFFKRDVLKSFTNFAGKDLCWSLFLIKLQTFRPATLLKKDSSTGVFLWNFAKF